MRLKLVTAPSVEPITLAEAKKQSRIETTDEDTYILGLIRAVREDVESLQGRALITQTWDYYLDAWPGTNYIKVPLPPLQTVTSITYVDLNGESAVFASSNYIVDTTHEPGRIYLKYDQSWPSVQLQVVNGIYIRFTAGYGSPSSVPEKTRQAMLVLVALLYENREDTDSIIGGIAEKLLLKDRIQPFTPMGDQ